MAQDRDRMEAADAEEHDSGAARPDGDDEPGLEARLRRLEEIVSALEADDLELDRALELFEEGVIHVRLAEKILAETELRVEELLDDEDGLETRPFEHGEG